ncbi:unnamed protein product [Scytosiphon promiscuus]
MGEKITLQRRSLKVDIQLSSFATFPAFESHVASKFELEAGFVITDFDRESVIDDAVYAFMRSGDYWRRNPKANRLFLVLDDIAAPLEGDVELEVSYQPHFNTITKTGDANFSKIPHAVAELIDNSIQATTENPGPRKVEVEVELGGRGGSFLVVRDNGKGMNASGLKDFATYFLTQENRGVSGPQGSSTPAFVQSQPNGSQGDGSGSGGRGSQTANGKGKAPAARTVPASFGKTKGSICSGFISKFGVGALQAGFYIGSCLTVVTKTARLPDVCEFVMNEAEFERRAETNAAMFRDKIKQRNPGKSKEEGPEAERNGPSIELLDRLRAEEVGKSQFTYIILTLRDQHVEWFSNHEKGSLQRELASIYHYYLHPGHCPDGILRDDDESSEEEVEDDDDDDEMTEDSGEEREKRKETERVTRSRGSRGGGSTSMTSGGGGVEALEITYTRRSRPGQAAEVVLLNDVNDDLESRLNAARKDSFLFHMEVLHPMQNPRDESKRLPVTVRSLNPEAFVAEQRRMPVTGVIHYYPYDGEKETRPQARADEEDDESITIEAFWEGRLVPESHAAGLSFFPPQRLNKKEREALGTSWRRRIKGMLFFDWNFPISNNKLKLQFLEGDLHTALNSSYALPKHPAVIYPGVRGRSIQKEFREWLIRCHETLDIEYRFEDKMPTPAKSKFDKWKKMTFGKGGSTFAVDNRVKLPFMKPYVYGVINFFRTEVDDEEEEGRGPAMFSLQRFPADVFGDQESGAKLYPVTELDPVKSTISSEDWDKAMSAYGKQLPARTNVIMTGTERPLPKRLTIRTGRADSTKVSVQIYDGNKKPMVQIPQGKALRVVSMLERENDSGEMESVLKFIAKPFTGKQYDKMYFFEAMNIKEPGEYTWTVAVVKEGMPTDTKADRLLEVVCHITVLPGNPTKSFLEGDDWDVPVSLGDPCWLPAFAIKLRDSSKCVCPMRAYKSVTVSCSEPGAFEITHASSGSATHEMSLGRAMSDAAGPLEYDDQSWRLVPKQGGLLSASEYRTRDIEFVVTVVAHMQQDRHQDEDEKVFNNTFEITFQPGKPAELVLLSPIPDGDGPAVTADAGSSLPQFSLGVMDGCGNRTAPPHNEAWQVSLEITAASEGAAGEEGPEFAGPVREKVAAGAASFNDSVVKWHRPLKAEGELAVVEAALRIGTTNKDRKEVASASFTVRVMPSRVPFRAVVCLDGNAWPNPEDVERAPAAGTGAAKAADAVGVRRSYTAGSAISGLHLRLYDQGGSELVVGEDTFEASNKEAVTCSWDAAWRWPSKNIKNGLGYDLLPDLKVPTQLSRLDNGVHHAKVVVTPKPIGGWPVTPLPATFAFAVHAGPVARWMAVKASAGSKVTDNVSPLVITTGDDAKACHESFKTAVKGFLPVDEFGNLVKNVPRAPEIRIEGMPLTKLLPEHQCKLMKPTKANGYYQFPRSINLEGPPGESGHLLIMCSTGDDVNGGGAAAGDEAGVAAAGSAGDSGVPDATRVLRLAVSIKAGPPVKALVRSVTLGAEEFVSEIRATQLSGVKVSDLEVHLVDKNGFPAHIDPKGVKVMVTPRDALTGGPGGGVHSPRGGKKNASAKKDLSKRATHQPLVILPKFTLDQKLAGQRQAGRSEEERLATIAEEGVPLVVRAEGSGLEIAGAMIYWIRQRTAAVTKVNLAAIAPSTTPSASTPPTLILEEPALLSSVIGQRVRRVGLTRPVDGPLPTLVVWLDTDNGTPCEPPHDSISFVVTRVSSPGADAGGYRKYRSEFFVSRPQTNLYQPAVLAPESMGRPQALIFKAKRDLMDQNIGEHCISCTYVERRPLMTQDTQREDERVVEISLRVVAGSPVKLEPMSDDANLFHSLSASNQQPLAPHDPAARDARRLVEKTFRFTANDCRGNLTGPINGPVRMRIENLDGVDVPASEMPRLEDSDHEGYVVADPTATGVFLFEENWLQPGVGTRGGDYKLVVDSGGDPQLQSWSTKFHFDTDEKRLNSIREVKARLKPLEDKIDRYNAAFHAASLRAESARGQAEEAAAELSQSVKTSIGWNSQDFATCIENAKRLTERLEHEQQDRLKQQPRPAKFETGRMRPEDENAIRPVGYAVQLGFVDDEYRAKILSQKGGSKMKAVYVTTKEQLDMVRMAKAGCFCQETVATFKVPGENRPRNSVEMATKQLPLRPLRDRGFLGYLANMIQLPDAQEYLRDTLFNALYGSMVMFDTHNNAHAYQVRCKRAGQYSLPILVEEDGASLERNGYMPPARDPDSLNRLKHVYGSMPPNQTPIYERTKRYIRQLKNLVPALEQVLDAEAEMVGVEQNYDADGWRQEMATLTNELEELMSRGTPARKGRGVSGVTGGTQSPRGNGVSSNGRRSSSGGGAASGARESKKKKAPDGVGSRSRPTKRARRAS